MCAVFFRTSSTSSWVLLLGGRRASLLETGMLDLEARSVSSDSTAFLFAPPALGGDEGGPEATDGDAAAPRTDRILLGRVGVYIVLDTAIQNSTGGNLTGEGQTGRFREASPEELATIGLAATDNNGLLGVIGSGAAWSFSCWAQ